MGRTTVPALASSQPVHTAAYTPAPFIVGLSGNISNPSRTRALVETTVERATLQADGQSAVYDILDLQPSLGTAYAAHDLTGQAREAFEAIIAADALVVASPVYKGSYLGLFKHLFDLVDPKQLAGKPVILGATGGSERHALVIEHQLRPLFSFFGTQIVPTGLYATEKDFDGYAAGPALSTRIDLAAAQLSRLIAPQAALQPAEPRRPS
jgi:FMN reductase